MTRASAIIHDLAGRPTFNGAIEVEPGGNCWLCGGPVVRGVPTRKWQGANFTDQNKARCQGAAHICEACAWCCSWVQPPGWPAPPPGKKGVNLRLFSHLWAEGEDPEYCALNKGDKPAIRQWLRRRHPGGWLAAIADSGQKHTLPWTPVNSRTPAGAGVVWFEERTVTLPGERGWHMVDDIGDLLTMRVPKAEILLRHYSARTLREHRQDVKAFEREWGLIRGGGWFELAVWLAQKDEVGKLHGRLYGRGAEDADGRGGARVAEDIPPQRSERAQALGADHDEAPQCDASDLDGERVGDGDDEGAGPRGPGQIPLF